MITIARPDTERLGQLLRIRMKWTPSEVAHFAEAISGIVDPICEQCEQQLSRLEQRIEELERKG
jgi:hypothetical protein